LHFLAEKHTLKYLLKEHLIPKISDRKTFEAWKEAGGKDIVKVAKEKVHEILATHKPETIPKDVQKDIAEIFARYKKECSKGN
jgi:trimethylamine--corrinoid protein Co-methyltransferase